MRLSCFLAGPASPQADFKGTATKRKQKTGTTKNKRGGGPRGAARCFPGDERLPRFGLSAVQYAELLCTVADVVACAADQRSYAEVEKKGTREGATSKGAWEAPCFVCMRGVDGRRVGVRNYGLRSAQG